MLKGLLQNELFYCNHLGVSDKDEEDIRNFRTRDSKGMGLVTYIRQQSFIDESLNTMRTYIVRDNSTSEMVGYFSLKAGLISCNEHDVAVCDKETGEKIVDKKTGDVRTRHVFDTLPGVELANFAVNQAYIRRHPEMKGVGEVIYRRFILPIVKRVSEAIGIKILYIFALPYDALIARYEKYGFSRLDEDNEKKMHSRLKPSYDESCIFMFKMLGGL